MSRFLILSSLIVLIACRPTGLTPYEAEIRSFRTDYLQSFVDEERSPLAGSDLKDLSFFVADSIYKVEARYILTPEEIPFDLPTSSGKTKSYRKYASLVFELKDTSQQFFVYESMKLKDSEEYKDYLFLPFNDATNGFQTYGGGRYIDLLRSDFEDGTVTIDFNKCYNPWCAYSDGFNCPVPPSENQLDVSVFAGERKFEGEYKFADIHDNQQH